MRVIAGILAAVLFGSTAFAANPKEIDAAIKAGADYLKTTVGGAPGGGGGPGRVPANTHGLGGAALVGLALLEAGVKTDDASIKSITESVRGDALNQSETYHVALAILYLDRRGDPLDSGLIQMLGVRLYAGMNSGGGWGYHCWEHSQNSDALLKSLQTKDLVSNDAKKEEAPKPGAKPNTKLHAEVNKTLETVVGTLKASGRSAANIDDNSNTQFGIIGLWVAARHGVPARDAFALLEARFIRTQSNDGGWSYSPIGGGGLLSSTPAMTCAGLLGLLVGKAGQETKLIGEKPAVEKKKTDLPPDDPFFSPKKADGEKADPLLKPKANAASGALQDKSVLAGLQLMGGFLGGQAQNAGRGVRGDGALNGFLGAGNSLYTLWSLERVGVGYSLDTIGGIDWYQWGLSLILPMQQRDGSFNDSIYGPDINTSFALLFLCKANFTKDLSSKKAQDPIRAELKGGGNKAAFVPSAKDPSKSGSNAPDAAKPMGGGFTLPGVAVPTEQAEIEKVAKLLIEAANDAEFRARLDEARDGKGTKYTRAMILAAARLDGDKRYQTREALAERLTRMTPKTLKEMLKDPEAELRRAACLAIAMKEDLEMVDVLIERLTDSSDFVIRASRAALKSLSNADFGPANGADDDAKIKAAGAWSNWNTARQAKK